MREKLKKILSLALAVMLVVGLVQIPAKTAKAAGTPEFVARFTDISGNTITEAEPGDEVKLILSSVDADTLTAFQVNVLYDEEVLIENSGDFTDDFYDYMDSIPSRKFLTIGMCTMTDANGIVKGFQNVFASDPKEGYFDQIPPTVGTIDIACANVKIADDFVGELPVDVFLDYYVENAELQSHSLKKVISTTTLTVNTPEPEYIPMTGFTLNKEELSFDLSSDTTTDKLSVASYEPENTTDAANEITWTTSDNAVADVSADGTVTAVGKGTATITATITNADGTEISRTCEVEVKKSVTKVEISSSEITLKKGQTQQLTATATPEDADDTAITWKSSDDSIATVDENGLVTAVAENGTTSITASTANGTTAFCYVTIATRHLESIKLNKKTETIARGETSELKVTYSPDLANVTDEVSEVKWSSDDKSVATVKDGVVTAEGKGTATITASVTADGKEFTATCEVTVNVPLQKLEISDKDIEVLKGESKEVSVSLNPTDADIEDIVWSIDGTSNATITPAADNMSCTIKGVEAGKAVVTVTESSSGKTATVNVTVTEIPVTEVKVTADKTTLDKGETTTAEAVVLPEDTTDSKKVVWSSDNEEVATVDQTGKITAVGGGTAVIRATSVARADVSGTVTINVEVPLESIAIEGSELELVKNQTAELTVVCKPADTTVDKSGLTWKSDNQTVATVDENGKVTAKKAGTTLISAELDGKKAVIKVTVTEISLDEIALDTEEKTVDLKDGNFALEVLYNEDTTDEFVSVEWVSSNNEVATVDKDGNVTLVGAGDATITVTITTDAGTTFTASCDVTVVIPMTGLKVMNGEADVTGSAVELIKGDSVALSTLADPVNTTDVIDKVEWASSDAEAVSVNADGVVTTLKESKKPVTITATATLKDGTTFVASVQITAVEIHIESITLSASDVTLEAGETSKLTVDYLPANTTDVKEIQTWASNAPEVATVVNGVITAHKGGTAVITATTANGKSASCNVNVPIHIESVTAKNIKLQRGDAPKAIEAVIAPENTADDKTLTYVISYEDGDTEGAIKLSADGVVTPVKEGTAHVVITAVNAYGEVKPSTTIKVTVTEQHLTDDDLAFTNTTAGIDDVDEDGVHQVRIDEQNPHIEIVYNDQVTDDVYVAYTVAEGSEDVIAIDENGNLTFLKAGSATVLITVSAVDGAGNVTETSYEYEMNIYEIPLTSMEFAKDSKEVTVAEGSEKTLTVEFTPADTTDKDLTWTSSDPTIATVTAGADGKAVVKGLKVGEVTITAVSTSGLEITAKVTVTAKPAGGSGEGGQGTTDNPGTSGNGTAVKTGDTANPLTFLMAAVAALFAILVVLKKRSRRAF